MRTWQSLALSLGMLLPAACGDSVSNNGVPLPPFAVGLQPVITAGLSGPIDLQAPPGDSRLFIAERPARSSSKSAGPNGGEHVPAISIPG